MQSRFPSSALPFSDTRPPSCASCWALLSPPEQGEGGGEDEGEGGSEDEGDGDSDGDGDDGNGGGEG